MEEETENFQAGRTWAPQDASLGGSSGFRLPVAALLANAGSGVEGRVVNLMNQEMVLKMLNSLIINKPLPLLVSD